MDQQKLEVLLISKNITVDGRRTSIRLERASWEALDDICSAEGVTLHDLCTMIDQRKNGGSRTSAVRSFIVSYYREATSKWSATLPAGLADSVLAEAVPFD